MSAEMTLLDHFAELLSQHSISKGDSGGDVAKAAAKLGQSPAWGKRQLQRLRDELGDQAR